MTDSDSAKLAVARAMVQAWNAMDWEASFQLFAEDGVLHSMMIEPIVGRDAVRRRILALVEGLEWIELRVNAMGVIDGRVFFERLDVFRYKGRDCAVPVVGIMDIDGGKVRLWREYYDRGDLLRQMGLAAFEPGTH